MTPFDVPIHIKPLRKRFLAHATLERLNPGMRGHVSLEGLLYRKRLRTQHTNVWLLPGMNKHVLLQSLLVLENV